VLQEGFQQSVAVFASTMLSIHAHVPGISTQRRTRC